MKNLFFSKGNTNWLGVVLVSSMIGALTAWLIIFMSDSILEISAPDSTRKNGNNELGISSPVVKTTAPVTKSFESDPGLCGMRIVGREPNTQEKQQCAAAGGEVICGTVNTDYVDKPGTSEDFCDCVCGQ